MSVYLHNNNYIEIIMFIVVIAYMTFILTNITIINIIIIWLSLLFYLLIFIKPLLLFTCFK